MIKKENSFINLQKKNKLQHIVCQKKSVLVTVLDTQFVHFLFHLYFNLYLKYDK